MRDIFGDDDSSAAKKQDDFGALLESSLGKDSKKANIGDRVYAEIVSISKNEVFVTMGPQQDGVVSKSELLEDGVFPFKVGEHLELFVGKKSEGLLQLTTKMSSKALAETLEDAYDLGTPVDGKVTEICPGGFRINIQGKTAFCPQSQIDLKPGTDPQHYIGKKFEFVITKFEQNGRNIVASRRKALEMTQQENIGEFLGKHKVGELVEGTVNRIESYGAFVEIAPQLDGLAPISELSFSHLKHPSEAVTVGQKITVKIILIDDKGPQLRITLSKKQAEENPWLNISSRFQVGMITMGKVTKCMPFGAFVEISPGIEGLVPLSEMSYGKRVLKSDEMFKAGDNIAVMIKQIQEDDKRMTLSFKDSEGDPWAEIMQRFPVGTIAEGEITRKEPYGLFVQLQVGITGLLPKRDYENADNDLAIDRKKIGDRIVVQIQELDLATRKVSLKLPSDNDSSWQTVQSNQAASTLGNLGDQFKDIFSKIKKG